MGQLCNKHDPLWRRDNVGNNICNASDGYIDSPVRHSTLSNKIRILRNEYFWRKMTID